jgi:hypothetical protein
MSDIGFALNYTNIYMLKLADGSWGRIGAGISSIDPSGNEKVSQDEYYDGGGLASSDVTGGQMVIAFKGHRVYGDPVQDYIASRLFNYGEDRKAELRWVAPDGAVAEGECTIANIKSAGGDANSKGTFEFEAHFNGIPTLSVGEADTFPVSITSSEIEVGVGASVEATATASPVTASQQFVYAIEDTTKAIVDARGNVKGIAAGTTKLNIKSATKPTVGVTVDVTVTA